MKLGDEVRVKDNIALINDDVCTTNTVADAKKYIGRTFVITQDIGNEAGYFSTTMLPYFHKDWIDSAWVDENWIEFVSHGNIMQKNTLAKFTTNEEFKEELEEFLENASISVDSEITIEDYNFSDGQYEVHIEGETFYINSYLIVTKEINFDTL